MAGESSPDIPRNLGDNIRRLRETRGLSQQQLAKLSGVPRPTWANLESGGANPTLAVLTRVASTLQVSIEELISPPRASLRHYKADELPSRQRGGVRVRGLLPDPIPGIQLERMELPPGARMTGIPHTPGTREYLACEHGSVALTVAGGAWTLVAGDVLVFRGDQRHAYHNPGDEIAVAYSTVLLAPGAG
jgi:XRE family transcriptional regulator, regulator of sulfur utilization